MDDFPLTGRRGGVLVFLGRAHVTNGSVPSSLTPLATILSDPSGSGLCSFKASSDVGQELAKYEPGVLFCR